jgi:glutamine synthetase type III
MRGSAEAEQVERLIDETSEVHAQAELCYERVRPLMERMRQACDALEQLLPAGASGSPPTPKCSSTCRRGVGGGGPSPLHV